MYNEGAGSDRCSEARLLRNENTTYLPDCMIYSKGFPARLLNSPIARMKREDPANPRAQERAVNVCRCIWNLRALNARFTGMFALMAAV